MEEMSAAAYVREQYRTENRLQTRRSVWRDSVDGRNPVDAAARAVSEARPSAILEVGCGIGVFAKRLRDENPQASVVATDQSERFVELSVARGLSAAQADVQALPFRGDSFDIVVAMWMLYHVPDLDRALAEVRRVLHPGGLFVAVTNGDRHLADLMTEAGGEKLLTTFSSENGATALQQHFDDVAREGIASRAAFDSHEDAVAYLATLDETLAAALPPFDGPRDYTGATTVFLAR